MESDFIKDPIIDWLKWIAGYKRVIIISGLAALVAIGCFTGYELYQKRREEKAHKTWVSVSEYVNAQVRSEMKDEVEGNVKVYPTVHDKWQSIIEVTKRAYAEHGGTSFGPFFLTTQADGYVYLGKLEEAIEILQKAVKLMPRSDVKEIYEVKLALIKLDSSTPGCVEEGLASLNKMAQQDVHPLHDYVLYQLGEYYWAAKQFEKVKHYWKLLMLKYSASSKHPSPWMSLAQPRLALLE